MVWKVRPLCRTSPFGECDALRISSYYLRLNEDIERVEKAGRAAKAEMNDANA